MKDDICLTPYFLDDFSEGLAVIKAPGWQVNSPSTLRPAAGNKQKRMVDLYRPLRDFVSNSAGKGRRPVSIAGDCCTSIAVLAGLQSASIDATLIWLDAHGDFNTWETTPSGFLGGMPLAMLVGRGEQTIVDGVGLQPFPENRVILTDARDLDPGEITALENSAVTHLPDISHLMDHSPLEGPLYIHFDVDIIDTAEAPAMSYPAPGGPPVATIRQVFKYLAGTGRVAAVSLSAWNPALDEDGLSQQVAMSLLAELLG